MREVAGLTESFTTRDLDNLQIGGIGARAPGAVPSPMPRSKCAHALAAWRNAYQDIAEVVRTISFSRRLIPPPTNDLSQRAEGDVTGRSAPEERGEAARSS